MPDFTTSIKEHANLPEDQQRAAGKAIGGQMDESHASYLRKLIALIDEGSIIIGTPASLLHQDVYDALDQESKDAIDLALLNLHDQVRIINDFYRSSDTPDVSPHLETMIEQLWKQKDTIEQRRGDVFKL